MTTTPAQLDRTNAPLGEAQIESRLEELEHLATTSVDRDVFYRQWGAFFTQLIAGRAFARWEGPAGELRPVHGDFSEPLSHFVNQVAQSQQHRFSATEPGKTHLAFPVPRQTGRAVVLVGQLDAADNPALEQNLAIEQKLALAMPLVELAEQFELRQQVEDLSQQIRGRFALDPLLLRLSQANNSKKVVREICESGRQRFGFDRLAVFIRRGSGWKLAAVNGVSQPDRRSEVVRAMQQLVRHVVQEQTTIYRSSDSSTSATNADFSATSFLATEADNYLETSGSRQLMVVPCSLASSDTSSRPAETDQTPKVNLVLLAEQFHGQLPECETGPLNALAAHASAAVQRTQRGRWGLGWLVSLKRLATIAIVTAMLVGGAAALTYLPAELTLTSEAQFVPVQKTRVFTPLDAKVSQVLVKHGEVVSAGQLLVQLESLELEIQRQEAVGTLASTQGEIEALRTAKLRAGMPGTEKTTDASTLAAKIEVLQKQMAFQAKAVELLEQQQARLNITSPHAGKITSWRPEDYLAGRPVQRGQRLLEVAKLDTNDTDHAWRIEAKVPDRQAGHLLAAMQSGEPLPVEYVVKSAPSATHAGTVNRVASSTQVDAAGQATLLVEISPQDITNLTPRNGMTLLVKINCGESSLGYVWFHEAWESLQRFWF